MKRTIVVTGAASGIGRATAEILEQQGDTVIRVDLEKGDVTGDLGDRDAIVQVAQKIADLSGGRIDGLVANAGVSAPTRCRRRSTTSARSCSSKPCARCSPNPTHHGSA